MIVRIALAVAMAATPAIRWRQFCVPVYAGLGTILLLGAIALPVTVEKEHARLEQRTAILASIESESDLLVLERDDSWKGRQYLVFWLQPVGTGTTVLPPGIQRLPEAGEVALSPALAELRSREPELARRFPHWFQIEPSGIVSAGELLAYARPRTEPGIRNSRSVLRVSSFGPSPSSRGWALVLDPPPDSLPVSLAIGAMVAVPVGVLVGTSAAGASSIRERRLRLLARLGAPVIHLRGISSLEAAILAAPGACAGLLGWLALAAAMTEVPFVHRPVLRSDVSLNAATLCAVPVLVVFWAGSVAALTARVSIGVSAPKPEHRSLWRIAPVLLGAAIIAYGALAGGYVGRLVFLGGLLAMLAANVILAPVLVERVGAVLGASGRFALQFSGRRMEHDPARWARPFIATGTLAVIAFITVGQLAISRQNEPTRARSDVSAATVRWQNQGQEDIAELKNALTDAWVYPMLEDGNAVALGADCPSLASLFRFSDCFAGAPYALSEAAIAEVGNALGVRAAAVQLVPPEQIGRASGAVVLSESDPATLHEHTRTAAMRSLTAPTVVSQVSFAARPSPLVPWLIAGLGVAGITLSLAAISTAVDRSLSAVAPRILLLRLGVSRRRLRFLESVVFGASFATIVGSSVVLGALVGTLMVWQTAAAIPIQAFSELSAAIGGAGIAGVCAFWAFHRVSPGAGPDD